ncbi:MAG: S-layer homology domain-containing protein [Clostridia bacterium]|nr:S-layer homology domain-containing protein [Clostridia bacterium]
MKNSKWMKMLFLMVSILTISTSIVLADNTNSGDTTSIVNSGDEIKVDNTDTKIENDSGEKESTDNEKEKINTQSGEKSDSEDSKTDIADNNTTSGDKAIESEDTNSSNNKSSSGESTTDKADSTDKSSDSKVKKYKITTTLEKGGKITPENPEVEEGKSQRFEIVPYEKYKITDVIVDGINYGSTSTYTIHDIKENHTIEVKFLKITNEAKQEELQWNNKFVDVKSSDWFYDAVRYVNKHDLFKGVSDIEFAPNSNLTRGMLVTVLFRFSNAIEYAKSTFDDVSPDAYYTEAVSWATKNGIVNGVGDNKFAPDSNITRQDLATIIYRYARFKGKGFAINSPYLLDYIDRDSIAEYAYEAICWCTTTKVMNGKENNMIDPVGLATRAETATIMQRLADALNQ